MNPAPPLRNRNLLVGLPREVKINIGQHLTLRQLGRLNETERNADFADPGKMRRDLENDLFRRFETDTEGPFDAYHFGAQRESIRHYGPEMPPLQDIMKRRSIKGLMREYPNVVGETFKRHGF